MIVKAYHSHIYFDSDTVAQATALAQLAGESLSVSVGRVIQQPIGPHPKWSCQLAYPADQLNTVLPWLAQHRDGLTIFTHMITGDDLWDHTKGAIWMGSIETLNLDIFKA